MKSTIYSVVLAGALALSGAAYSQVTGGLPDAQSTIVGTVASVDVANNKVTLDNGQTYTLPEDHQAEGIRVGNTIMIHWSLCGTEKVCDMAKIVTK